MITCRNSSCSHLSFSRAHSLALTSSSSFLWWSRISFLAVWKVCRQGREGVRQAVAQCVQQKQKMVRSLYSYSGSIGGLEGPQITVGKSMLREF